MTIAQLFSISFYHWWIWFGCSPNFLPHDAKEVWDFWVKNTITMEPYMREVQFFRQFDIAWIFFLGIPSTSVFPRFLSNFVSSHLKNQVVE